MGCDDLVEKTSPLDGIYYILDGWEKFEAEDYDRAKDLFSTVLLDVVDDQYFTEAYVGLAWNSIYKANTMQGSNNFSEREYERNVSNENLNRAMEHMEDNNETCPSENSCSILCQNLLAGRTYNSSYKALEASRKFYDYGLNPSDWQDMLDYSDSTIAISKILLEECNSEYVFNHDELITSNLIRVLRVQTYLRKSEFDLAEAEIILIDDLQCDLSVQTIFECFTDYCE